MTWHGVDVYCIKCGRFVYSTLHLTKEEEDRCLCDDCEEDNRKYGHQPE